jgi:hypothetical protein
VSRVQCNMSDEMQCFMEVAQALAELYALKPHHEALRAACAQEAASVPATAQALIERSVFPAMQQYFFPPKTFASDGVLRKLPPPASSEGAFGSCLFGT